MQGGAAEGYPLADQSIFGVGINVRDMNGFLFEEGSSNDCRATRLKTNRAEVISLRWVKSPTRGKTVYPVAWD